MALVKVLLTHICRLNTLSKINKYNHKLQDMGEDNYDQRRSNGCMLFNAVFNSICCITAAQCTYSCFPGVLLTSALNNIPSKPFAAFPQLLSKQ